MRSDEELERLAPLIEAFALEPDPLARDRAVAAAVWSAGAARAVQLWREQAGSARGAPWLPVVSHGDADLLPSAEQVQAVARGALAAALPHGRRVLVTGAAPRRRALALGSCDDEARADLADALFEAFGVVSAAQASQEESAGPLAGLMPLLGPPPVRPPTPVAWMDPELDTPPAGEVEARASDGGEPAGIRASCAAIDRALALDETAPLPAGAEDGSVCRAAAELLLSALSSSGGPACAADCRTPVAELLREAAACVEARSAPLRLECTLAGALDAQRTVLGAAALADVLEALVPLVRGSGPPGSMGLCLRPAAGPSAGVLVELEWRAASGARGAEGPLPRARQRLRSQDVALARRLVEAAGGRLELGPSGSGTRVLLRLPASP